MSPSAQSLILQVLSACSPNAVPVRALVAMGELFDIKGNSLRVILARLVSSGLVTRGERGLYRLAEGGRAVQEEVAQWASLEDRVKPWDGGWIGASTGGLTRTDRTCLRRRERALRMLGFRELSPGLWVRPDNLGDGVDGVRQRLFDLGLEEEAIVCVLSDLGADVDARARRLWDMKERRADYRATTREIERAIRRLPRLRLDDAMRETFLLGGKALRLLAFDPLLPTEISSDTELWKLVEAMREYDELGQVVWGEFIDTAEGQTRRALSA